MSRSPLITHPSPDSVIAWRDGQAVTVGAFLNDVQALAQLMPPSGHVLNTCSDRYRFMVGLSAALLTHKISLLPSTQAPEMIRQMQIFASDVFCLTDNKDCSIGLPLMQFPESLNADDSSDLEIPIPQIDNGQTVAYVFTSGSTGAPVPHRKTWGALVRNVQGGAALSGLNDGRAHVVIGTVPAQHMYGFESTVLLVMQTGNAMLAARTFYPADIAHAIEQAPRPRVLVSTPVHMKALLSAAQADQATLAVADLIISATAPLSVELAQQIEAELQAPLLEIYGCTETGQIAMRRSTQTANWQLFPGVELTEKEGACWASGAHIEQATPLNDVIERIDARHFSLHGRLADLINIAGKRNSLAYLNLQLTSIEGVVDGAFLMPDEADLDGVTRLMAFVVAPKLTSQELVTALRARIDAVFLPRPLVKVASLPRNATGKLPRQALLALAAQISEAPSLGGEGRAA